MKAILRTYNGQPHLAIKCPGCGEHCVPVYTEARPDLAHAWKWNGSLEAPVLSPSIREKCGPIIDPEHRVAETGWNAEGYRICHSYVGCNGAEPGQIVFLGDCTHEHAGKVMELPEWPRGDE